MASKDIKSEAGALAVAKREWREDQKRLAKAPADDSQTPHIARLVPYQIMEIERMAGSRYEPGPDRSSTAFRA